MLKITNGFVSVHQVKVNEKSVTSVLKESMKDEQSGEYTNTFFNGVFTGKALVMAKGVSLSDKDFIQVTEGYMKVDKTFKDGKTYTNITIFVKDFELVKKHA